MMKGWFTTTDGPCRTAKHAVGQSRSGMGRLCARLFLGDSPMNYAVMDRT